MKAIWNFSSWKCLVVRSDHMHWLHPEWCMRKTASLVILAEGAIALSVTLSGGALFASWKLLQFPSRLIVKVIRAIFRRASAQPNMKTRRRKRTQNLISEKVCNRMKASTIHMQRNATEWCWRSGGCNSMVAQDADDEVRPWQGIATRAQLQTLEHCCCF
jgi:hypothetical protein